MGRCDRLIIGDEKAASQTAKLKMQQEQQQEKQMADSRSDFTSQFQAIAKNLEI